MATEWTTASIIENVSLSANKKSKIIGMFGGLRFRGPPLHKPTCPYSAFFSKTFYVTYIYIYIYIYYVYVYMYIVYT